MASTSRAIVVIGMHRSGTSAIARGLQALGVYLGNDFLAAQPENPTGYWEDRGIVNINERVLKALGLTWDDAAAVERRQFDGWRMWRLRREAQRYLRRNFLSHPLWGFKDPRTIRVLPFWRRVLAECSVDDAYLLVLRNPSSVAASLYKRKAMSTQTAQRLWLAHVVPFLKDLVGKPLVVVDYDLLMLHPRQQLERIATKLQLRVTSDGEVERFVNDFLDPALRHTAFLPTEVDANTDTGLRTRDAFSLLYEIAEDRAEIGPAFWDAWDRMTAR